MTQQQLSIEQTRSPILAAIRALPQVSLSSPPAWTESRLSGTRAQGRAYESRVGEFLFNLCEGNNWKLWDHQWFVYSAAGKRTYFQPDFIIERETGNLLVEVKLTYIDAERQIERYINFLSLFGLKCDPVLIVRNLTPRVSKDRVVREFSSIIPNSVLHLWI